MPQRRRSLPRRGRRLRAKGKPDERKLDRPHAEEPRLKRVHARLRRAMVRRLEAGGRPHPSRRRVRTLGERGLHLSARLLRTRAARTSMSAATDASHLCPPYFAFTLNGKNRVSEIKLPQDAARPSGGACSYVRG